MIESDMQLLFTMDRKNYRPDSAPFIRPSVRGILIRGGKVAMVHSAKFNYYKFPGGGIEPGEDHIATLIREVAEEAGLRVIPETIRAYGRVYRVEQGERPDTVFIQNNFYYLCQSDPEPVPRNLDEYEREEGFSLCYVNPHTAIEVNRFRDHGPTSQPMLEREARVLEMLILEGYLPDC